MKQARIKETKQTHTQLAALNPSGHARAVNTTTAKSYNRAFAVVMKWHRSSVVHSSLPFHHDCQPRNIPAALTNTTVVEFCSLIQKERKFFASIARYYMYNYPYRDSDILDILIHGYEENSQHSNVSM